MQLEDEDIDRPIIVILFPFARGWRKGQWKRLRDGWILGPSLSSSSARRRNAAMHQIMSYFPAQVRSLRRERWKDKALPPGT